MRVKHSALAAVMLVMLCAIGAYWAVGSAYIWKISYTVLKTESEWELFEVEVEDLLGGEIRVIPCDLVEVSVTTYAPLVFEFSISGDSVTTGLEYWEVEIYHGADPVGTITKDEPTPVSIELSGSATYTFSCDATVTTIPYTKEAIKGSLIVVLTVKTPPT